MKLLSIAILTTLIGCSAALLGNRAFDITDFDFSTPLTTLLPDKYKDASFKGETYEGSYLIPTTDGLPIVLKRDTTFTREGIPQLIFFTPCNVSQANRPILFAGQHFNSPNLAITPEGQIVQIGGYLFMTPEQDNDAFITRLTQRYGKPKVEFKQSYDLYTWTLKDRTIKYAVVEASEPILVIEKDASGQLNFDYEEPQQMVDSYLFIIDAPWVEKILSTEQASGDFVYCK